MKQEGFYWGNNPIKQRTKSIIYKKEKVLRKNTAHSYFI